MISSNAYLTLAQMRSNAQAIMQYLLGQGWSKNAIAAMLGNMQTESTINPGIWESLDSTNSSGGFGLVQWTPSTKYINWAIGEGYTTYSSYANITPQLLRIIYELNNGLQWISTSSYSMTFAEFSVSTGTPEYLAQAFLYNYERPASLNQPDRSTQARYWFDLLSGNGSQESINSNIYIYPVSTYLSITQGYSADHVALDLGWNSSYPGANEQPIIAVQDGIVRTVVDGYNNTYPNLPAIYGNYIIIEHADNRFSLYGHLKNGSLVVNVGDSVTRGQHIADMGNTGYSNGQHLHFELRIGGNDKAHAVNPILYLNAPTTLYISPTSLYREQIIVVNLDAVNRIKRRGYNFILFNKERRKRLWNANL